MNKYFYIVLFFLFTSVIHAEESCLENRAALDIGSGATKYKVFSFDHCKHQIDKLIFEKQFPILFKENLNKSADKKFTEPVLKEFSEAISEIKKKNEELKVVQFKGMATEAFRQSENGKEFLKIISDKENISLQVITQEEESNLGFKAAFQNEAKSTAGKNQMMWDIGGGSMQIVLKENDQYFRYLGKLASVSFKDLVIKEIKKKSLDELKTPNPLTVKEVKLSTQLAKDEVKNIPNNLKKKIGKNTVIVGVGGVFQYSLLGQLKKEKEFTLKDLKKLIKSQRKLKDEELKSTYASTDVTNIILVASFMEALKINHIIVRKANLTDAIVLD